MRVLPTAVLAALLVSSVAAGQTGEREITKPELTDRPTITLAAKATAAPGQPFRIPCTTNCRWFEVEAPAGVVLVPREWVNGSDLVGYGQEGAYTIVCRGSLNDVRAEARCQLVVSTAPPVPPGPGPTPVPPGPAPKPPAPVPPADPLAVELQSLYTGDASPQKAAHRAALASLYRSAADYATRDQSVTTVGQFFAKLKNAGDLMVGAEALKPLRMKLSAEHKAKFPRDEVTLDADTRAALAAWFGKLAAILETIK